MLSAVIFGLPGSALSRIEESLAEAALKNRFEMRSETVREGAHAGALCIRLGAGASKCSPRIPCGQADLLCGFDPGTGLKYLPYLKNRGSFILLRSRAELLPGKSGPGRAEGGRKRRCGDNGYDPEKCVAFLRRRVQRLTILELPENAENFSVTGCKVGKKERSCDMIGG